ncbi:MAG TPA: cytochrome b N-terminal domain-containing protein [Pirellulales bacterium]|nr:cytochrome b N-terminal domain-containing protein [Pirellulales bacterium]
MFSPLPWLDEQSGLVTALGNWFRRPVAGGPEWRFVWPVTIAFTFLVQAITGLVIWMYYSPGAQSSWESVYYLQYRVLGGWLLRAIHYYAGQVLLVLIGLYIVQMLLLGTYTARRTVLYWTVLLMALVTLGLNLTGDLLPWDQNSYWASGIRIAYLAHTPVVGPWLAKLAVGGQQFGTFTITRFLALHAGVLTAALLGLIWLHAWLAARQGAEVARTASTVPYWPQQTCRDAAACLIVLAIIVGLSLRNGVHSPNAGIELGAPANLVDDPGTARPEWSFRGLYELHEKLAAYPEIVSIMIIPGVTVLLFFAMPFIGRNLVGRVFNVLLLLAVLGGVAALAWESYAQDAKDEKYQAALVAGKAEAERAKELATQPSPEDAAKGQQVGGAPRIPAGGARTLLRDDPKTQGPRLFNQHCASCHDYSGAAGITRPDKPTAADLAGFAGRKWLKEFLTNDGIGGAKYFGNTKFKRGKMYEFVKDTFADYEEKEKAQIIAALSHEAELKSQATADADSKADIAAGVKLISENCTECHVYHGPDKRADAKGPDLTGYGSGKWLIGMISDPAHKSYYGKSNDRMPAFAESAADPKKNRLSQHDLELLADWLRGEWYEAGR